MPQARLSQFIGQSEVTYRTAPAAAAKVIPITEFDSMRDARRQANTSVSTRPLADKTDKGDPTFGGPFKSIFELRAIGFWLKLLLGNPSVGKAVTTQPVNVTGVSVNYASTDCTAGNGTLAFTFAGTTVTWMPQGGSAGTAVNIGAGGNFTVQGGGGGKSVNISVTAAALPGTNQNDATISVHATLKAHAFPFDLADRPSALIERQEPDIAKYHRFLGVKVPELSWDLIANDQVLSGRLIPAIEVDPIPSTPFDAAPTSYGAYVRACAGGGRLWDGSGTGLGTILGGTVGFDNKMTPETAPDGLDGYGYVGQDEMVVKGTLRTVFDGAGAYALARAGTSTRLRLQTTAVGGADTFGVFADFPAVELVEKLPPRSGKSGLIATLDWMAHNNATVPSIWLVNDVAAY